MIPNMYKISGELLPRRISCQRQSPCRSRPSVFFGDHADVMSARQTGFAFLASSSVQEVMDLGGIATLGGDQIESSVPSFL